MHYLIVNRQKDLLIDDNRQINNKNRQKDRKIDDERNSN